MSIYDKVPYDSMPQKQGNLRLLETVADLFGVPTVDVRNCRVLELGTALGKTIIHQAEEFPNSRFLGIDLSREQIVEGRKLVTEIGLDNIELRVADIMGIDDSWGTFDYIIVHGIYSWVPEFVQKKILDISRDNLSERGIAVISYNTYPGWHAKEMVRNLLLFHIRTAGKFETGAAEITEAKKMLDSFAAMKEAQGGYDAPLYRKIREEIQLHDEDYIYHEYLESENRPCYFNDFRARLEDCGLEHVSDFDWEYLGICLLQESFRKFLGDTSDRMSIEQYLDYFSNRTLRSSVITRKNTSRNEIRTELSKRYFMKLPPSTVVERSPNGTWTIKTSETASAQVAYQVPASQIADEVMKRLLEKWNVYFSLAEFSRELDAAALNYSRVELEKLCENLIRFGLLKISLRPPYSGLENAGNPLASRFTRCVHKEGRKLAVNPDFECFTLSPFQGWLVSHLDGRNSLTRLAELLFEELKSGRISCNENEMPPNPASLENSITRYVEELKKLQIAR